MAKKASRSVVFTVDDITFDPVTHTSTLPDGRPVPHVTAVLEAVGVATDFEELADMGPRMADQIRFASARGTAVHADTHAYDDNDLMWETVDPLVLPYVQAWVTCREQLGLVPLAHGRERRLYHPVYHYTGITDGVFMRGERRILPDLKTGDPESAAAHLQTAAYESAWNFMHLEQQIDERWAIWLRPGRKVPYTIINYTARQDAWQDFQKWQAALCVYNEQPGRRVRCA